MTALARDLHVRESGKLRKVTVLFIEMGNTRGGLSFGGEENQKFWVFSRFFF